MLRALGFTTNFAPLIDVTNETSVEIIGTRSFASSAQLVQRMALSFSEGLTSKGISPVLKHWPGLGGYPDVRGDWNANLDLHLLDAPLTLRSPVTQYQGLYRALLQADRAGITAIMTAHIRSQPYQARCPAERNIVTFCRAIVKEGLREALDAHDVVIFADDIAYLRAARTYTRDVGKGLQMIFDSDHDIAIVSSTVPYARQGRPYCGDGRHPLDCSSDAVSAGLESLYRLESSEGEIRESVKRILGWKYRVYRNLLGEDAASSWLRGDYAPVSVNFDDVRADLAALTDQVLKESLLFLHPPHVRPSELPAELNIRSDGRVFCVGPTLARNDLREALSRQLGAENVDCIDLPYSNESLNDADELSNRVYGSIETAITTSHYDAVVFGLVNKPAHVEVLNRVIELFATRSALAQTDLVIATFNSPMVLDEVKVADSRHFVFSVFSNVKRANELLVDALLGKIAPGTAEKLPVGIRTLQIDDPNLKEPPDEDEDVPLELQGVLTTLTFVVAFFFIRYVVRASTPLSALSVAMGAICYVGVRDNALPPMSWGSIDVRGLWPWFGPLFCTALSCGLLSVLSSSLAGKSHPRGRDISGEAPGGASARRHH